MATKARISGVSFIGPPRGQIVVGFDFIDDGGVVVGSESLAYDMLELKRLASNAARKQMVVDAIKRALDVFRSADLTQSQKDFLKQQEGSEIT